MRKTIAASAPRRKFRFTLRAMLAVVTLFCGYMGSYHAMLEPIIVVNSGRHGIVFDGYREANYRIGAEAAKVFFYPIHTIDRWCRPDYWSSYSDWDDIIPY